MQAIIMAAGKGSRLGELTGGKPKSFVEINGKKLIEYNLNMLKKFGINDIIIVTGYNCEAFEELVKNMQGITLVYNPFYEMMNVLGSFFMGMNFLHDDFVYLHADTICEPAIFKNMLDCNADVVLPVEYGLCNEEAMKVKRENGKIVQITKNMPVEFSEGEFIGITKIKKEVIPLLKEKTKQLLKEKQFHEYFEAAIQRLIDEENFNIETIPTEGKFWAEIDFIEDYNNAKEKIPEILLNI